MNEMLDISKFNLKVKDNHSLRTRLGVIGLGATGSAFMMPLAHFMKNYGRYDIDLFDPDYIGTENMNVSMYGFSRVMGNSMDTNSKAYSSRSILRHLLNWSSNGILPNANVINQHRVKVDYDILRYNKSAYDVIFVFTDNNKARYEVSKYHSENPKCIVLDCRVGSYDQFELYFSNNPSKYAKTIYYNKDGSLSSLDDKTSTVCLDQRMNFSIALTSASYLMNLYVKYLKGDMKEDFKHIMIGNDYLGEVKGYE